MAKLPSFLERFEYYKNLLKPVIKNKTDEEVRAMLCHCRYYKAGRMKKLVQEERILYDLLEKNNLSASTIYEYYTSLHYPESVKKLLFENKISMTKAQPRAFAHKRMISTQAGKELMAEIKLVVGGLEWKGLNSVLNQN